MLVDKYHRWLQCVRVDQVPTIEYACPDCSAELHALRPPVHECDWDSLVNCPYCQNVHYRVSRSNGNVDVWRLQ